MEVFSSIVEQISGYIGDGEYFLLYIAAWIMIIKSNDIRGKEYLAKPMLVIAILIFNPIMMIILNICLQSSYWRAIWFLQENLMIAYAMVLVLRKCKKNIRLILVIGMSMMVIFAGNNVYHNNGFDKPENLYKIPDEMIEICEMIKENEENAFVATLYPVYVWIGQYDVSVKLAYTKNLTADMIELKDLVGNAERDYTYLHEKLVEAGCNILVIRQGEVSPEEIESLGYILLGNTENYVIYRIV